MARYIDADALKERLYEISVVTDDLYGMGINRGLDRAETAIDMMPTADVVPRGEVEKIFEKLKVRECSNSVCAWCVNATAYGRRNEECDKPYIDKNGKEQKACYVYAKFESLIDNELAELKKKYTEGENGT